jgi:hypothetical protein
LASAREHPPAVAIRRQQRDVESVRAMLRDFNERQSQLFFTIATFLLGYQPPDLYPLLDVDVAEATRALGSTYQTASRGVIYEHRPQSLGAERLAGSLKAAIAEAGQRGGSVYERDAAVVLNRIADACGSGEGTAFLDLLRRIVRDNGRDEPASTAPETPRLILP